MPGEIAEMMLDGTLCEGCGEFLGDGQGFPGYCSAECARGRGVDLTCEPVGRRFAQPSKGERAAWRRRQTVAAYCPMCGSHRGPVGLADHLRDAHGLIMTVSPGAARIGTWADIGVERAPKRDRPKPSREPGL